MKITVEMTEKEFEEYQLIRRCIRGKRETDEILDLANRLDNLAKNVYAALSDSEENGLLIINESYAKAALALATRELY